MFIRNRKNNQIKTSIYAPVRCKVTIMYATSSTKDSSLLIEAYFVALLQNVVFSECVSTNMGWFNDYN